MSKFQQLSLAIKLDDQATFENFYAPRGSTQHLAALILQDSRQSLAYLVGSSGCGLSHLLQAACQKSPLQRTSEAIYLPMAELSAYEPAEVLAGLQGLSLVCVDDLHSVAGQAQWQLPLFNFFNHCRESGTRLVFASHKMPENLGVELPDLLSRLHSGLIHRLVDFGDDDLRRLLQFRANGRGLYLSDEVAKYLLSRLSRDPKNLIGALETLDQSSLQQQRRLTVPFVKATLDL